MKTQSEQVAALFDHKAAGWGSKYGRAGPLHRRLDAFQATLSTRVLPGASVLELGCGAGDLSALLAGQGYRLSAFDVAPRMLDQARLRFPGAPVDWQALPVSWTRLPVTDAAADAVVASSVLEYLEDLPRTLDELARVLRPGGWLLATVPDSGHPLRWLETGVERVMRLSLLRSPAQKVRRLNQFLHYLDLSRNRCSPLEWRRLLSRAGFARVDPMLSLGALRLIAAQRDPPTPPA